MLFPSSLDMPRMVAWFTPGGQGVVGTRQYEGKRFRCCMKYGVLDCGNGVDVVLLCLGYYLKNQCDVAFK
jgi:hypothetical protein